MDRTIDRTIVLSYGDIICIFFYESLYLKWTGLGKPDWFHKSNYNILSERNMYFNVAFLNHSLALELVYFTHRFLFASKD